MQFDIITLFPAMFSGPLDESILARAQKQGLIKINIHQLRDWGIGKHRQVDDTIYGGGVGMLLRADVILPAIGGVKKIKMTKKKKMIKQKIILLTPQGKIFDQKIARRLAKQDRLILVCGHYEGFDERIRQFVDEEISIGDYILTGGELPAMILVDTISRLIPKVLAKQAILNESFSILSVASLEYPQYTKPEDYKGLKVPDVLLSGNHQEIEKWRKNNIRAR